MYILYSCSIWPLKAFCVILYFLFITLYSVWPVVAIPLILVNLTVLDEVAAMCPSPPVVHIVTTALNLIKTCTSLDMDTVSEYTKLNVL